MSGGCSTTRCSIVRRQRCAAAGTSTWTFSGRPRVARRRAGDAGRRAATRAVALAAAAAVLAVFLWASAPSTGVPDVPVLVGNVVTTTRYALPALAGVAFVLGLAGTAGQRAARLSAGILVVAVGWDSVWFIDIGAPQVPTITWIAAAAVLGGVAAGILRAVPVGGRLAGAGLAVAAIVAGLFLGQQAGGYVQRLIPNSLVFPSASVAGWFEPDSRASRMATDRSRSRANSSLHSRATVSPTCWCWCPRASRARQSARAPPRGGSSSPGIPRSRAWFTCLAMDASTMSARLMRRG